MKSFATRATVALALLAGCTLDLAGLRGAEEPPADGGFEGSDAGKPPDAGRRPGDAGRISSPDAGPPRVDAGGVIDSFVVEDAGPPPCGVVGGTCCQPGNSCISGACLRGRCVAYGGAFARSPCALCQSRNVYTAGCGCPAGFAEHTVARVAGECGASLTFCEADVAPDFGGSWARDCAGGCSVPNATTGDCSCPIGAAIEVTVLGACGEHVVGICAGELGGFAGAFQVAGVCRVENPHTDGCACPPETSRQEVPLGVGTLHVCSR